MAIDPTTYWRQDTGPILRVRAVYTRPDVILTLTLQFNGESMKVLVAIKRVVDYNVKVRAKADGTDVDLNNVKMAD
jgi:hypothetical protein